MKHFKPAGVLLILIFVLIAAGCNNGGDITETAPLSETQTETEQVLITVFGKSYPVDISEISIEKDDITSYDLLLSSLKQFSSLSVIDLNGFEMSTDEYQKLEAEFAGSEIKCKTYVISFGKRIYTDDSELDLSGISEINVATLKETLSSLPNINRVASDTAIPLEDKEALISEFPGVAFELNGAYEVYGVQTTDNEEELDLHDKQIDVNVLISHLKHLPKLQQINLYGTNLNGAEQTAILNEFQNIHFLWDVAVLGQKYDGETEDLDLSGKKDLTADMMRGVIPLMPNLKRVDMSDCASSYEELAALREEFPTVKIVWRLKMGKWSLKTDAVAFSVLIYDYNYTRLTSDDIQCLKYCTDLQALDLGHQALTDLSVIGDYLTELRILILADNKISDLTPLSKLKHLHYIELFVNRPLKDVSPLGECKELVDVNISHLYDIWDISNLLDLPLLERLWIEHTSISDADVKRLRETYPDTKIIVEGYGSVDQGWREHPRYFAMIDMFNKTNYISEEFSKYDR